MSRPIQKMNANIKDRGYYSADTKELGLVTSIALNVL